MKRSFDHEKILLHRKTTEILIKRVETVIETCV